MDSFSSSSSVHVPVLVQPILQALLVPFLESPKDQSFWMVDCTLGGGGHTGVFLDAFNSDPRLARHRILAFDQDAGAVARGRDRFVDAIRGGRLEIVQSRFSQAEECFKGRTVLGLMADLGFSSDQLEDAGRGLSFRKEGPLDMRLDPSGGITCAEYLREVSEDELERVLREYGGERFSRRIASELVQARRMNKFPETTTELSRLIVMAIPPFARHGRIHAATRSFQALRIAVNGEIEELDRLLGDLIPRIHAGGRVAILSFHSIEDRKVKIAFGKGNPFFIPLTRKPLEADEIEVHGNPRARSAKLRIAQRI